MTVSLLPVGSIFMTTVRLPSTASLSIHALLVGHGERGDVHHILQFRQYFVALFQLFRVTESDCRQLFWSEISITEHPLETVYINVGDVAYHQDGLLPVSYTHLVLATVIEGGTVGDTRPIPFGKSVKRPPSGFVTVKEASEIGRAHV